MDAPQTTCGSCGEFVSLKRVKTGWLGRCCGTWVDVAEAPDDDTPPTEPLSPLQLSRDGPDGSPNPNIEVHTNGHSHNGNGLDLKFAQLPSISARQEWRETVHETLRQVIAATPDATVDYLVTGLLTQISARERCVPPANWFQNDRQLEQQLTVMAQAALDVLPVEPSVPEMYVSAVPLEAWSAWQQIATETREYSVEGLIRWGATGAVSGLMGAGKTTFMINLVRSWATGEPFLGRVVKQSRTLVVASPKEIDNWLETLSRWGLKERVWVIESTKVQLGSPQKAADWFAWAMKEYGCTTFALDTLFDFFGMPSNNSGDQNRIVMNEQNALLSVARTEKYAGIGGGHQPKTEATALVPRDPEEAFSGQTGWMAQHRMRISLRRKSKGFTAIITGRGGYGDSGILEEMLLKYDDQTRLISLGGPFNEHLGEAAVGRVVEALKEGDPDEWVSRSELEKKTGLSKSFIKAGLKRGMQGDFEHPAVIEADGNGRARRYRLVGIGQSVLRARAHSADLPKDD